MSGGRALHPYRLQSDLSQRLIGVGWTSAHQDILFYIIANDSATQESDPGAGTRIIGLGPKLHGSRELSGPGCTRSRELPIWPQQARRGAHGGAAEVSTGRTDNKRAFIISLHFNDDFMKKIP